MIYARNSLSTNDPWFALTNFTLPESPYLYIDTQSPSHPQRFYQVLAPKPVNPSGQKGRVLAASTG